MLIIRLYAGYDANKTNLTVYFVNVNYVFVDWQIVNDYVD
jgi:hypothetical protein